MVKNKKGLTNDEILSLYLYSAGDELNLSHKIRESHRLQETCKFKKIFQNVTRAALKIYQTFYSNRSQMSAMYV